MSMRPNLTQIVHNPVLMRSDPSAEPSVVDRAVFACNYQQELAEPG